MNPLALVALAAGLAVVIAAWQTRRVQAIEDPENFPSEFGVIDLAAGQTARLSVVSLHITPPQQPLTLRLRLAFDIFIPADESSCVNRYIRLRREFCDVELRSGETVSYDYDAPTDARVAASVHSLRGPDTREGDAQLTPEPHLAPTLQVREGTRTIFVVPGVAKGFNAQPDPPGEPQ